MAAQLRGMPRDDASVIIARSHRVAGAHRARHVPAESLLARELRSWQSPHDALQRTGEFSYRCFRAPRFTATSADATSRRRRAATVGVAHREFRSSLVARSARENALYAHAYATFRPPCLYVSVCRRDDACVCAVLSLSAGDETKLGRVPNLSFSLRRS